MDGAIKLIKIPATLDGVSPRKDGSMSLRFVTQEMTTDQKTTLLNLYQSFGWLLYSDSDINEVPRESPNREAGAKTPSQRLRSVLFVLWQERYSDQSFDPWYVTQVEKIIERIKQELPPK